VGGEKPPFCFAKIITGFPYRPESVQKGINRLFYESGYYIIKCRTVVFSVIWHLQVRRLK